MNYKSFIPAGVAILGLVSSNAFAQTEKAYEHAVTLNLKGYLEGVETATTSANATREITSYRSVFQVLRFSNKQFLESLVQANVIPSITGWSVKTYRSQWGDSLGVFIVKSKQFPIDVTEYASFTAEEVVEEMAGKVTEFTNGNLSTSGTRTERGLGGVHIAVPDFEVQLNGAYVSSQSFTAEQNIFPTSTQKVDVKMKSAAFQSLTGAFTALGYPALGEGSVTVAAGKLVDFAFVLPF